LRRQSYEVNEEGLFNVEYADVFGIPFDFTAKPVVSPPQPPRETIQVKAVRPERDSQEIRFPRVQGYRTEIGKDKLIAKFNHDSTLTLTPEMVGATKTETQGIIGEGVEMNLIHTKKLRFSTLVFNLTTHLIYSKYREPNGAPELHLFGELKRIVSEWLKNHFECKGGTYPAQLMYQSLADHACERITAGITRANIEDNPVKSMLDPYNPTGSTCHVHFNTSKTDRYQTDSRKCHINWVILDGGWESEFCRVAESHPQVLSYVKNHNLGFEVPYRYGSESRIYIPDFIVQINDTPENPLNLIVEIKGYRGEDASDKKATMENYWVPGVNNLQTYGRWAFAEFGDVYQIEADFEQRVAEEFEKMLASATSTKEQT